MRAWIFYRYIVEEKIAQNESNQLFLDGIYFIQALTKLDLYLLVMSYNWYKEEQIKHITLQPFFTKIDHS